MEITYYKIKLGGGIICTFRCTTPRQKFNLMCELIRTNYELLDAVTVTR
jgi:hypothetical protein